MLIWKAAAAAVLWHIQPKRLLCSPAFTPQLPQTIHLHWVERCWGNLSWCQGKTGLAKGAGNGRTCASGWERLHPGLAGAGTRPRDMELGWDGHLSVPLWKLSPAWKGRRVGGRAGEEASIRSAPAQY